MYQNAIDYTETLQDDTVHFFKLSTVRSSYGGLYDARAQAKGLDGLSTLSVDVTYVVRFLYTLFRPTIIETDQ